MILPPDTIHRPILLGDNADVSGGPIVAQCCPALVVGVREVTPDHYVSNLTAGKTAYRTLNNARLALPADAWDVGSQFLTIEFTVEQNTPAPGQVGLFGFIRNQKPSPWYCAVVDGKLFFNFMITQLESLKVPWPAGTVTGKISLDLRVGSCLITLNGITQAFSFPNNSVLLPSDTAYFGVGAIADRAYGWGDYVGGAHDWTYHNLKVTGGPSSGPTSNESAVPFCRLLCDQPGPVCCYNGAHYFGFMLDADPSRLATLNCNRARIHDLTITSSLPCGPLIAVGGIYNLTFERLVTSIRPGGQSIASLGGLWTYPVRLIDCELGSPYYGWGQTVWASRTNFQGCGASFSGGFVSFRDTFVAGSPKGGVMMKLRDGCISTWDVGQADYEGLQPSAYFDYDSLSKPSVTNWYKGRNTPIVLT